MSGSSERSLDRLGAASAAGAAALLVALMMFFPSPPAADEPIAAIAKDVAGSEQALLLGDYVGLVMGGLWLLFGIIVAARLRRREDDGGAWWMIAVAGVTASAAIGFLGNVSDVVFVRAVGHGLADDGLWTVYGGDLVGFAQAVPLSLFMLGMGLGNRSTGAFPRWTGVLALVTVPLLVVGAASVAGREVDGAPFTLPLMLGFLGMLVWSGAVSVVLWREQRVEVPSIVAEPA